jgi:hypothetical protein
VSNPARTPYITELVHYESYGTPGGEHPQTCRPAIVIQVNDPQTRRLQLAVFNPNGLYFNDTPHDEGRSGGSWHWSH